MMGPCRPAAVSGSKYRTSRSMMQRISGAARRPPDGRPEVHLGRAAGAQELVPVPVRDPDVGAHKVILLAGALR